MTMLFESSIYAFGFYAALNALIMLVLGMLVTRARTRTGTEIGTGDRPEMVGPFRAHANNTEYVPMGMVLMLALLPIGSPIWLMHAIGAPLTVGRIVHAMGLHRSTGPTPMRLVGMALTWIAYIIGIVALFWLIFVPQSQALS